MINRRVAAVLVLLCGAVAVASRASAMEPVAATGRHALGHAIDLNAPGALDALARSNPVHYERIRAILDGILQQPDGNVPRWIHANFDGRDVSYAPIVLTSHPPKRRLSFALDATRYETVIVLTNIRGEIVPLR
jgi:hypothetical protein